MDKGFEKYHKRAFLKHQAYLGFNGPSKQINAELNTPLGWAPFWQALVAGTSQGAAAKLRLSPLHRVVWTFSFLPPAVPSRPCWLSGGPCWSCLHQCLKCLSTLRGQLFFSWPGLSSAAKAGSEWAGGWRLRNGFPLSWLWFRVPEGLLLLAALCSPHWAGLASWAGTELLDSQGFLMGEPWIGSPWAQASSRSGRSTQLALRGRSKVASSPLGWQLTTVLTSLKHETSSSRAGQILCMWGH